MKIFSLLGMTLLFILFSNCKKQDNPVPNFIATIAYIHANDVTSSNSFKMLLADHKIDANLIPIAELVSTDFSKYKFIITGNDAYLTAEQAQSIRNSGKPLIGIGEGGYATLGKLSLKIGYPNGWHGSNKAVVVLRPNENVFRYPKNISLPTDKILNLYTNTSHVGIYLPNVPSDVTVFGAETGSANHYPILSQNNTYFFWGFTNSPSDMTSSGKDLFVNLMYSIGGL